MPDLVPLGLGLDAADVAAEDLLRLVVRRLAQLEVQLRRIADAQELRLKLDAVTRNIPLSAVRSAEEEAAPAAPVELLTQTPEELAKLDEAFTHAEERLGQGKVPLDLDLYAEAARMDAGNADEEA